ncbi:MAG: preprotein translocase subunit SecE [Spirochaetales bacterium]
MKVVQFFKESLAELKKVTWPTRDDVLSSAVVVLISTVIIATILGLFDAIFTAGFNFVF